MKRKWFLIFIFLGFFSLVCRSQDKARSEQNRILDSLFTLLKTDEADTNQLVHLANVSFEYLSIANYELGLQYGNKALNFADILLEKSESENLNAISRTTKIYKAKTHYTLGNIYRGLNNYAEGIKNFNAALKLKESLGDQKGVAGSYNNIGLIYADQGNYVEALKYYLLSLKIKEKIGDKKGMSNSYNNIGLVYYDQANYREALKNHAAALKIRKELNDRQGIAYSYNNIANVYFELANYEEALNSNLASLKIMEDLGEQKGVSDSYNNIAGVYYEQALKTKDETIRKNKLEEAFKNFKLSLDIRKKISYHQGIAASYSNIAGVLFKQKKYNEAKKYFINGVQLSKESGYRDNLRETYKGLSELDSTLGDYKGAYQNHKLFILYRDSLDNEDMRNNLLQTQMTYDFEKKEAIASAEHKKELESQNVLATEKSRKQKVVIVAVVIGLLLVLIFAAFVFRSLRLTRKQKFIIEEQKHLVEENQKEIIDSITYAKRLQQAILPSNEELKKHLPNHFIVYKPKAIVAGDFYWFHVVDDFVFIAAADSTGHGVPGAMVSVVCSNALNRAVDEFKLKDTGKILDKTRDLVLETFAKSGEEIKDGMDISLLCINKVKKQIYWSGANNQLWYLSSSDKNQAAVMNEIKANKQPIGKTDNPLPFTTHTLELNMVDILYLMTDGYADQFGGPKGKKYKYKALEEKLIATSHLSLQQQHEELTNSFNAWKGNLEQVDDVTIIGIRV